MRILFIKNSTCFLLQQLSLLSLSICYCVSFLKIITQNNVCRNFIASWNKRKWFKIFKSYKPRISFCRLVIGKFLQKLLEIIQRIGNNKNMREVLFRISRFYNLIYIVEVFSHTLYAYLGQCIPNNVLKFFGILRTVNMLDVCSNTILRTNSYRFFLWSFFK